MVFFRRESLASGRGIVVMVILPEITSALMRNAPEDGY
jgi:hypothetical protein